MAAAMVGEGTNYADLTYTISLNSEEYGVGFRKGSDLAAALNEFFVTAWADGTMQELAETYGVTAALIAQEWGRFIIRRRNNWPKAEDAQPSAFGADRGERA